MKFDGLEMSTGVDQVAADAIVGPTDDISRTSGQSHATTRRTPAQTLAGEGSCDEAESEDYDRGAAR
jgi:hypothetical protein